MSGLVFRARHQAATRYVDPHMPRGRRLCTNPPRRRCLAFCCDKKRIAANLTVQVYYDGLYFFCRPGKGCKGS